MVMIKRKAYMSQISASGEYRSIRHLVETLFAYDPNYPKEKMEAVVAQEYPQALFATKNHYYWYRNKIIKRGERGKRTQ